MKLTMGISARNASCVPQDSMLVLAVLDLVGRLPCQLKNPPPSAAAAASLLLHYDIVLEDFHSGLQ